MADMKSLRVLWSKVVRASESDSSAGTVYHLSPCDQLSITTVTARASFWRGARFDAAALERCVKMVLEDLPFLSGRVTPLKGLKLNSAHIALCNKGALLTVAEVPELSLEAVGPDSWVMHNITLADPDVPFYLDRMDGGRVLKGSEAIMKVRLTRLEDGDVLGITFSHCITDGMRWPAFMAHLAARYRQAMTGVEPAEGNLLRPSDRAELSSAKLAEALSKEGGATSALLASLEKQLPPMRPSLGDYWRAGSVIVKDSWKKKSLLILYLPKSCIQELKSAVTASSGNPAITSGDVIQALSGMLVNASSGSPLLPQAPKFQVVLVQLRGIPPRHFGNSVHLLPVQVPAGAAILPESDYLAALMQLASLIRTATADFRARPEASVEAMQDKERLVDTPVYKMVGWLAGHHLPEVSSTTNYIGSLPGEEELDFGFGTGPTAMRWLVTPMGSDMAVIRPAMAPYEEGVFLHLTLTQAKAKRLREHPLLQQLVPEATFLGGS